MKNHRCLKTNLSVDNLNNKSFLLISKIVFITCILTGSLSISCIAQTKNDLLTKQIPISNTQGTIKSILEELSKDHQINLSYDPKIIPLKKQIKLSSNNLTVKEILDQLFKNTNIKYFVYDDVIILKKIKKSTLSGYIEDAETGERLIGATVFDLNSQIGTITNNYGFYSLSIPEGNISLNTSYVGYKSKNQDLTLNQDIEIIIQLVPGVDIEEVTIKSQTPQNKINSSEISVEKISMKTINELPTLFGEGDIMKSMQLLPGIQFGSEASSGLVVRGGSPEQNLILLDGGPVYNSNHAFGLFSVFNSDAIKNVTLIKGGFPARYGGRLSSVIDVRMKEGDKNEIHGSANIGIIASKFTLEGPIIKKKLSFLVSARRTYVDLFMSKSDESNSDIPAFYFYDVNAKLNYQLSKKDRLFYSFYWGNDNFTEKESWTSDDGLMKDNENTLANWGNKTSLLRWNHLFNNKLFSNLSVLYSEYELKIETGEHEKNNNDYKSLAVNYNSGIQDVSANLEFDYYPASSHKIKFGANYLYHTFNPGKLNKSSEDYLYVNGEKIYTPSGYINTYSSNNPIYANEFRVFIEDDFSFHKMNYTNIGLHYSGFLVDNTFYYSLEPRISTSFILNNNLVVKAAYSRMKQYIHLLTHSNIGLPTDLWLPVTSTIKPQYSNQYTVGLVHNINEMYELNIETYYKTLHQIYTYKEGVDLLSANNTWENNIEMGNGKSYGVEFMFRKHFGKLNGWISYTYSKSTRQFEQVNNGESFPYKYDRTNQLNIVLKYAITPRLSVNTTWIYATGMAYTLATEKYSSIFNLYTWNAPQNPTSFIDAFETRNNARMPDYHRLDIAFMFVNKRKRIASTWILGAYNVYGRFNPYLVYWDNDMNDFERRKLKQVALFSIIPILSYRLDF